MLDFKQLLVNSGIIVHWFVGIGIEDNTFEYVRDDVRAIEQSYLEVNDL